MCLLIIICMTYPIPDIKNTESGCKANKQNHGGGKCHGFALLREQTRFLVIMI